MNSHNANADINRDEESVRIETDHKDVRILRVNLRDENSLSIDDDFDTGGDPYNSTGQHVVLKAEKKEHR